MITTIAEGLVYLEKEKYQGVKCPCCGKHKQVYFRRINITMVKDLREFYKWHKNNNGCWMKRADMSKRMFGGSSYSKLAYWDLLVTRKNEVGSWKITTKGINFLLGYIQVKEYAIVEDADLVGLAGQLVDVWKCLSNVFDWRELMNPKISIEDREQMWLRAIRSKTFNKFLKQYEREKRKNRPASCRHCLPFLINTCTHYRGFPATDKASRCQRFAMVSENKNT